MDPVKLKAIQEWSPPANVKAVRFFLGFCNFYQKFTLSFSDITCPLLDLTKQSNPWTWRPNQETAFCNLQNAFTRQLVLAFPDTSKPFTLMMNASLIASVAVLMQINANRDMQPCGYLSQTFSPAEQNYDIFDHCGSCILPMVESPYSPTFQTFSLSSIHSESTILNPVIQNPEV